MDANVSQGDIDEVVLVGGMTRMPLVQEVVSEFFKKQPAKNINPDEVVAMGAAIQADELIHQGQQHILLDVTPLDLGIAVHGGKFYTITPKNTTIPCSNSTVFTTSENNQTSLRIVVLQGEHTQANDNQVLAEFTFSGIRPAPAGQVDIEITFDVDADGIVNVTARDLETQKEHIVSVSRSSNLTQDEIDGMKRDNAAYYAAEANDVELRNALARLKTNAASLRRLAQTSALPDSVASHALSLIQKANDAIEKGNDLSAVRKVSAGIENALELIEQTT